MFIGEASGIYSSHATSISTIWDKANVLTVSARHELTSADGPLDKTRLALQAHMSRRFERRHLAGMTLATVTSTVEGERLYESLGRAAYVLPSAVDVPDQSFYRESAIDEPREYLWLSSLDYEANVRGLLRFIDQGLPVIREAGHSLRVIGSGGRASLRETLTKTQGINYLGYVPRMSDALRGVACAVVPVWEGAGIKMKTLTLMAHGIPVVATPVAMEGIPTSAALAASPDAEELARAMVTATIDSLSAAGAEGRQIVSQGFSSAAFEANVDRLVHELGPNTQEGNL